jgi:AcrR family transcriptional regulator
MNVGSSKDELFDAAVEDALESFGATMDQLTVGMDDPAQVFAQSFRPPAGCTAAGPS